MQRYQDLKKFVFCYVFIVFLGCSAAIVFDNKPMNMIVPGSLSEPIGTPLSILYCILLALCFAFLFTSLFKRMCQRRAAQQEREEAEKKKLIEPIRQALADIYGNSVGYAIPILAGIGARFEHCDKSKSATGLFACPALTLVLPPHFWEASDPDRLASAVVIMVKALKADDREEGYYQLAVKLERLASENRLLALAVLAKCARKDGETADKLALALNHMWYNNSQPFLNSLNHSVNICVQAIR